MDGDTFTGTVQTCSSDIQDENHRKAVKSTAVVKYSAVQSIANFAQLQCNTDLNLPPSNWLSSSAESYGLQCLPSHSSGFSSFRMAHMFPDCVGKVDVVSDAENIKKLLKIPYSKGPVSMMVHRVENTLLIDEFDIHKHLLRTAESEWEWLKKFFFDHVLKSLSDKEKGLFHKNNSRYALQQKSLISKFLYHSLAVAEPKNSEPEASSLGEEPPVTVPVATTWPPLPEPRPEENLPDPTTNHKFARNVVWTFEDIQMLIGTDMPIFGGVTHPCISLRLRDMSKPISVLTGIDYWLDNLMCNVPELVMCYHLDGIVQKYELVKTEDLPHLENSKFSPEVIRDIAQNILSFLKSNAAKAGHTYWLFKGKDDDVVKLYDLTSLCTDITDDKEQNPFTIPVAMLLYRVARNMKHSTDGCRQHGTIRMLLENCLALLAREKYPQIVTSAHYMLSDLYVPADTDPSAPCLDSQLSDDNEGTDNNNSLNSSSSVPVKALCETRPQHESKLISPPPLNGSVEDRCRMALEHVASGLQCLQYFDVDHTDPSQKQRSEEKQEEFPKMAQPFQAIPMPYSPLSPEKSTSKKTNSRKKKKKPKDEEESIPRALLCKPKAETIPSWKQLDQGDNVSWNMHLKILLYEKACLVYVTLAESHYVSEKYGRTLHYIVHVLNLLTALNNSTKLNSYLLGRAGDCCFMIVQDWAHLKSHQEDYDLCSEMDVSIMTQVDKDIADRNNAELKHIPEQFESLEQMLQASCSCYQKALALESQNSLHRRLGNIHNELGVLYMNQYQESKLESVFSKSLHHLEAGVKAFEVVHDKANLALLYSNKGRLMRVCAHFHSRDEPSELTGQERHFYNKALASYQKAVQVLGSRSSNPAIWDTVIWELSTTLFTMGTLLQDYSTVSSKNQEEVERQVVDFLMKALKYCDLETPGSRQPVYQFRAASIHHRLASLYHRSYRTLPSEEARLKNVLFLSRLHYDKASNLLMQLERPSEYLRVQLEHVALTEYQAQNTASASGKIKAFQYALDLFLQSEPILKIMLDALGDEEAEEELSLLQLMELRLQFVLRSLAKLCLNQKELGKKYKDLYSRALKNSEKDSVQNILTCLLEVLSALRTSRV